jgi:hypothetical protein
VARVSGFFDGLSADEVSERLARDLEQAQRRAEAATAVRAEIEAIQERVSSPRRELSVVVDASGRLLDVGLTDEALRMSPAALGRLLVETAGRAQQAAGVRAGRIAADAFGEDDPAVAHLRGEIEARAARSDGIEYR